MKLSQLLPFEKYGLKYLRGNLEKEVTEVLPPDRCFESSLVFISKQKMVEQALSRGATSLIKTPDLVMNELDVEVTLFEVPTVALGLALTLPFFEKKFQRFVDSENVSIHPTAHIGANVIIGDYAVIGAQTIIGEGSKIGSHVVIENNCIIGSKTILHPHVFIGAETEIGTECEIHGHTTIGSDGFGFVTNPTDGKHHKIPQVGRVIIEDRVEIGANCTVDRATLTETRIGAGSKIDNLVHIAHNCEIGENAILAGGFMMAGSSKIGKQFLAGGQAAVGDHVQIPDNVTLAGRTGVINSLTEAGSYGGLPAVKLQNYLKMSRALMDLPEIWKFWRRQNKN